MVHRRFDPKLAHYGRLLGDCSRQVTSIYGRHGVIYSIETNKGDLGIPTGRLGRLDSA
jgi:hypothetical protein